MQKDLEEMKLNIHTIQCVFDSKEAEEKALLSLHVMKAEKRGRLNLLTVRGKKEEIMNNIMNNSPVFAEILPLSLEEIFISETEVVGYDVKKLIF
jgi:ABC-2 type transport system ATP-binding protein